MLNNNIKTTFSIKDLENLSGIKAHTIRIWEKRYKLLEPERSDTNIRRYDIYNLQKLLNIAFLNDNGIKISKIAQLSDSEITARINEMVSNNEVNGNAKNMFKLAMMNFDQALFDRTYNKLLTQSSFREIFLTVFLDLLDEIGILWQTSTITPAHEHFISNLIKQKLLINTERVQNFEKGEGKTYVLFLPLNEIHELGLLYIYFELSLMGKHAIYLGQSVPVENLNELKKIFPHVEYISYFTIQPMEDDIHDYIQRIELDILSERNEKLHIIGRNTSYIDRKKLGKSVFVYDNLIKLIESI